MLFELKERLLNSTQFEDPVSITQTESNIAESLEEDSLWYLFQIESY
jgi:hypothetical protein